jgi:hypothetical protein
MDVPPSALGSLARKYRALAALRRGEREFDALAARALAREFPGALRELDVLSLECIDERLLEVTRAEASGRLAPWIALMLAYHARMRQLLAAKRRLNGERRPTSALSTSIARALAEEFALPIDRDLVARVADPPEGRLNPLVFELMARDLGLSAGSIERVLFPRTAPGERPPA